MELARASGSTLMSTPGSPPTMTGRPIRRVGQTGRFATARRLRTARAERSRTETGPALALPIQ